MLTRSTICPSIACADSWGESPQIAIEKAIMSPLAWSAVQKERRIIEDLEPVLNQHRLVIDANVARKDTADGVMSLLYQLTHITKDRGSLKHDDRVDALAHAVRYFRDRLQRDAQSAEQEHLDRLRETMLAEFRAKWFGRQLRKPGFAGTNVGVRR